MKANTPCDELVRKAVQKIREVDKEAKFIVLYGRSLSRRGRLSDIDLAVGYDGDKEERFKFRLEAWGELENEFDIQIFQDLPVYIKGEVVRTGKVLYYRDLHL
jgi:predicted nucleotidyltransferase